MLKNWSYSRLIDYEQCPYRIKLKLIDRIPEERSSAADRGTQIHTYAEEFINGTLKKLPHELSKFAVEFDRLRNDYKAGHVSLEGEWGFDKDWMPTNYKTAWLRVKGDAVLVRPDKAVVIDFKTGAKYGNELKHGEQCLLYAISTFIRNPELESITTELWYVDKDELTSTEYTRAQALRYIQPFNKRATKMLNDTQFMPNSNIFSCKWCPFGPAKGNQCEHGCNPGENQMQSYRRKFG